MKSPTRLGFIASESPGKRRNSVLVHMHVVLVVVITWYLPKKQTCLLVFVIWMMSESSLHLSLQGTLSPENYISTKICADEKTMYVKQLAKFCCIVHRADAQQKLSGGNAVLIGRGCLCNLSHCNISRNAVSVFMHFIRAFFFYPMRDVCSDFQR